MKPLKKIVKRIFLLIPLFVVIFLLAGYLAMPQLTRCFLVPLNGDYVEREGIYLSKYTPEWAQDSLLSLVGKARMRNAAFWQGMKGEPRIIYCYKQWQFDRMGVKGNPASTWLSLGGAFVVLGPAAFNLDIISHELCHAELQAQVGWSARDSEIPTWFDEGLAMQLDRRPRYAERQLRRFGADLLRGTNISELTVPEKFFSGEKSTSQLRYILAKRQVRQWLGDNPSEKLKLFCTQLKQGLSFEEAFNE